MTISSAITAPLPVVAREPFLVLIDSDEERRIWVTSLLTFAHYHVRAVATPREFFTWYLQHQIVPRAMLLGYINQHDNFLIQRLLQRMDQRTHVQQERAVRILFLANYLGSTVSLHGRTFAPSTQGCIALLEDLWELVPRQV